MKQIYLKGIWKGNAKILHSLDHHTSTVSNLPMAKLDSGLMPEECRRLIRNLYRNRPGINWEAQQLDYLLFGVYQRNQKNLNYFKMKKKKQSRAANRHKCRPVFLTEQELREAMNDAASCLRNRNYARHQQAMQRIARLKKELEDSRIDQQFHDDNRNMDRAEPGLFSARSCTCRSTKPTWRSIISRCFLPTSATGASSPSPNGNTAREN
ncbi:MAG: hypothetical protein ACLR6J_00295 [Parabacteroides merdae]